MEGCADKVKDQSGLNILLQTIADVSENMAPDLASYTKQLLDGQVVTLGTEVGKLLKISRGAAEGKVWWDSKPAEVSIHAHFATTLKLLNPAQIQNLTSKVGTMRAEIEHDAASYSKLFPDFAFDNIGKEDSMQQAATAIFQSDLTRCEHLICQALDSRNPKKHVLSATTTFGNKHGVKWETYVHPDLVALCTDSKAPGTDA